jgi:hypothetical protein
MKFVYELFNLMGTIEYVGETCNPKRRFKEHTRNKPLKPGLGKFYGRADIIMNVLKQFDNRKDAYQYQCKLQNEYGLISDVEVFNKNFRNGHSGYAHSEESKVKMRLARLGKPSNNLGKFKKTK